MHCSRTVRGLKSPSNVLQYKDDFALGDHAPVIGSSAPFLLCLLFGFASLSLHFQLLLILEPRFFSSHAFVVLAVHLSHLSLADYPRPFSFRKTNVLWKSYGYDLRSCCSNFRLCLQPCKLFAINSCDQLSGNFSVQSGHGLPSNHRQTNSITAVCEFLFRICVDLNETLNGLVSMIKEECRIIVKSGQQKKDKKKGMNLEESGVQII
ncbi:hypothetical protein DVH24_000140 [Malus domestica]|uniref:Uncharacterized protein n=1 Tax=Malus domestica TaxID=3750 RepID=A0A498J501_MALDO|nr:hypothetical protein DVH24_000140 [Malus domestica]